LIGTYNVLTVASNTLARSIGDTQTRVGIARDLDTIGTEILAALKASKAFNAAGGRGRGAAGPDSGETLPAALNFVANRLDYVITQTRPGSVERLRHLNIARAVAGRALESVNAAGISAESTSRIAPNVTGRFQLPDELQGVDPGLIIIYNKLNSLDALARSARDPNLQARLASDIDTMGNEIIAALTASKAFNSGRGNGGAPNPR
jgi:hypothetical protein